MIIIAKTIRYVGVNDHNIDLFEGQYPVPNGMAYNSYVVLDRQTAVVDAVEAGFAGEWLEKAGKNLTYLEPAVKILSALNTESTAQLEALAGALCRDGETE